MDQEYFSFAGTMFRTGITLGKLFSESQGGQGSHCQHSSAHSTLFHKLLLEKRAAETEPTGHTAFPKRLQMAREHEAKPS